MLKHVRRSPRLQGHDGSHEESDDSATTEKNMDGADKTNGAKVMCLRSRAAKVEKENTLAIKDNKLSSSIGNISAAGSQVMSATGRRKRSILKLSNGEFSSQPIEIQVRPVSCNRIETSTEPIKIKVPDATVSAKECDTNNNRSLIEYAAENNPNTSKICRAVVSVLSNDKVLFILLKIPCVNFSFKHTQVILTEMARQFVKCFNTLDEFSQLFEDGQLNFNPKFIKMPPQLALSALDAKVHHKISLIKKPNVRRCKLIKRSAIKDKLLKLRKRIIFKSRKKEKKIFVTAATQTDFPVLQNPNALRSPVIRRVVTVRKDTQMPLNLSQTPTQHTKPIIILKYKPAGGQQNFIESNATSSPIRIAHTFKPNILQKLSPGIRFTTLTSSILMPTSIQGPITTYTLKKSTHQLQPSQSSLPILSPSYPSSSSSVYSFQPSEQQQFNPRAVIPKVTTVQPSPIIRNPVPLDTLDKYDMWFQYCSGSAGDAPEIPTVSDLDRIPDSALLNSGDLDLSAYVDI